MLPHRALLAIAVVLDVALLARDKPISAKALAQRHGRTPRHLEPLLQALVRQDLLKGTRGPHGGYELARERRRLTLAAVVRAVAQEQDGPGDPGLPNLIATVVTPALARADAAYLASLEAISIEDLLKAAGSTRTPQHGGATAEFQI